jgi:hypothetical protein
MLTRKGGHFYLVGRGDMLVGCPHGLPIPSRSERLVRGQSNLRFVERPRVLASGRLAVVFSLTVSVFATTSVVGAHPEEWTYAPAIPS